MREPNIPRTLLMAVFSILLPWASTNSWAGHVTDLASAGDVGDLYDFNLKVEYTRSLKRAAIKREATGRVEYRDGIHVVKDLRFTQIRHILSLRAEAAIWRDLQFHITLPLILGDERTWDFAQNDGDPCGSPDDPQNYKCVNKNNSTIAKDKLLPQSIIDAMSTDQIHVAGPEDKQNLFYLPQRSGLDQLYLGLTWAPMNQLRDPTKPTWILGFEARIAVGEPMAFNPYFDATKGESPENPRGNTSVGRGLHQFHFFTTISKRFSNLDPWFTLYYLLPVAKDDSLYKKTIFPLSGQERSSPQHQGGMELGVEVVPYEELKTQHKFTIELLTRLDAVFEGRGYTEIWELFANNPMLQGPCQPTPQTTSQQKWNNGTYCTSPSGSIPYPGITSIENYMIFTGSLAFNLDFTKYFRGRLGLSLAHELEHFITFGDAGKDLNHDGELNYDPAKGDPEGEINPLYRPYIDMAGRRFRVEQTTVFNFFFSLMGRF